MLEEATEGFQLQRLHEDDGGEERLTVERLTSDISPFIRLVDSTTLVIGSMIGSGIFIVSADAARLLSSPGLLILAWILTAVLTIIGALCYGELAAAMPHAGGQYVYLREAFGPLFGFLYGWTTS